MILWCSRSKESCIMCLVFCSAYLCSGLSERRLEETLLSGSDPLKALMEASDNWFLCKPDMLRKKGKCWLSGQVTCSFATTERCDQVCFSGCSYKSSVKGAFHFHLCIIWNGPVKHIFLYFNAVLIICVLWEQGSVVTLLGTLLWNWSCFNEE